LGNLISWSAVESLFTGDPLDQPEPQLDRPDGAATAATPFWGRMGAEITRRPVRLMAACLATVLGPAVVAHAGSLAPQAAARRTAPAPTAAVGPPRPGDAATWLAAARQAAGTCPGLPPAVLVAVGQVETDLGMQATTSPAGAIGPMQFLPSTWAAYGADGDGDGVADARNPVDALQGAARLLCANGGADADRLPAALWNYNHSDDYVRLVLGAARFLPGDG
jgi:soluble lytic murein transglycosylase-like protein